MHQYNPDGEGESGTRSPIHCAMDEIDQKTLSILKRTWIPLEALTRPAAWRQVLETPTVVGLPVETPITWLSSVGPRFPQFPASPSTKLITLGPSTIHLFNSTTVLF